MDRTSAYVVNAVLAFLMLGLWLFTLGGSLTQEEYVLIGVPVVAIMIFIGQKYLKKAVVKAESERAPGNWWEGYVSSTGEITNFGAAPPKNVKEGQLAKIEFLLEAYSEGYINFTQCRILDAVTGAKIDLNSVQKHEMLKYLTDSNHTKIYWSRAPQSMKDLFSPSQEKSCGTSHEWDGCVCKKCGKVRPHEWGAVVEHDVSQLGAFDGKGEAKTWFIKTCKNCGQEDLVRTVYK